MARKVDDLFREATELPEEDRAELAGRLLSSLDEVVDPGVEEAWMSEVKRRLADLESGVATTRPWEDIKARLNARLESSSEGRVSRRGGSRT